MTPVSIPTGPQVCACMRERKGECNLRRGGRMTAQTHQNRSVVIHLWMNIACAISSYVCLSRYPSGVYHNNPHSVTDALTNTALKDTINEVRQNRNGLMHRAPFRSVCTRCVQLCLLPMSVLGNKIMMGDSWKKMFPNATYNMRGQKKAFSLYFTDLAFCLEVHLSTLICLFFII